MKLERIFSRKIVHIPRSSTLEQAAKLMRDHHVGALLVIGEGPRGLPVGLVTDRDLVIRAMAEGEGPRDLTVAEAMSPALATVPRSADVYDVLEAMRINGVRRLVVVEPDGAPAGIVSVDDVMDAFAVELGKLGELLRSESQHEVGREGERGALGS